jgi:hypothetical protein
MAQGVRIAFIQGLARQAVDDQRCVLIGVGRGAGHGASRPMMVPNRGLCRLGRQAGGE